MSKLHLSFIDSFLQWKSSAEVLGVVRMSIHMHVESTSIRGNERATIKAHPSTPHHPRPYGKRISPRKDGEPADRAFCVGDPNEGKKLEEVTYSISAASPACSSSQRFRISCSAVRKLPMAIRMVNFPCSLVCERKK